MSAASEYAELLKLIEVSGPFLSFPIFKEVFPQGLVKDSPDLTRELRELYDEWREARAHTQGTVSPAQREWLRAVFTTLLGWPAEWLAEHNAIPQNLSHFVAQHHETLRPDAALLEGGKPRLLISLLAPAQQPDRRPPYTTWNATCATRMAELLRATKVPLGLVTNGEHFTLVYAEPDKPTGFADFHAELWFDERLTLRAFRDFLSADALFNRPPEQTLDWLYRRSLENQQEVSTTLGRQVRRAVEMFVAALDRADRESGRTLLGDLTGEHIYEAALSLMMRLVFLFFAEERDLLPITNPVYRENYAVSTLHDQLREAADRLGEEVLERRYDAFPRLLATFRAVHGGIAHDLTALPAYGGDLFDPGRFAFLEGRAAGSDWRTAPAQPCPIHNRTVLHLLEALQFLEMKVPGGGRETRRLSFHALDIEQIGHVYEGLLDHTARRATETVLGLDGKEAPEILLSELNRRRQQADFVDWLADETGRSEKAIEKALALASVSDPLRWPEWEQVAPFAGLVRRDDNGDPYVIPAGSLYVTAGAARRQTGTQYTPRSLTESVVEHALAPLVYTGPAEGQPPEEWLLKPAGQILDLKICDFACGSAAFLVAAARYLSACLLEAWEAAQREHGANVQITPYGHPSLGGPDEELIPSNPEERGLFALRIVVERCLYGVDRNPLAVEMAKLSLWLLTLQRNRPFTFLDHAIRCGDSLLGMDLKQLSTWSLSGEGRQSVLFDDDLSFAADKREGLMKMQYRPGDQRRLLDAALAKTRRLRAAADRLIATAFEANPEASAAAVSMGLEEQEVEAQEILEGKRPFHWPLEFPEVFLHGTGFDAIIGNPPFMAGTSISTNLGLDYKAYLTQKWPHFESRADLCVTFLLRASEICKAGGVIGLVACNTVCQTDSRMSGLAHLIESGWKIFRAVKSMKWPGAAKVYVSVVCLHRGLWSGPRYLDHSECSEINSFLDPTGHRPPPSRLAASAERAHTGTKVYGDGFVLSKAEGAELLRDQLYREVVKPYLIGKEINEDPACEPSRFVIDFTGMTEQEARNFPLAWKILEDRVRVPRQAAPEKRMREVWWQFQRPRVDLYTALSELGIAWVIAATSDTVAFVGLPFSASSPFVLSHAVNVLTLRSVGEFGVLQSSTHLTWARLYGSSLKQDFRYTTTDCLETFPFPDCASGVDEVAQRYHDLRSRIMAAERLGLTALYDRFHDPANLDAGIAELRERQVEMERAVAEAYGWHFPLRQGFHETKQGVRYTISEPARLELLDRLLALNHERYAQEQAAVQAAPRPKPKPRKRAPQQSGLF
jgi:hypothetical protein